MTTTVTLRRPLDCTDCTGAHWTLPAEHPVTVHHTDAGRVVAVALYGTVYRTAATLAEVTR